MVICEDTLVRLCTVLLAAVVLAAASMHRYSSSKQEGLGLPFLASAATSNSSAPSDSDHTHPLSARAHKNEETTSERSSASDIVNEGIMCVSKSTDGIQQNACWDALTCPLENVSDWGLVDDGAKSFIQHSANSGRKRLRSDQDDKETPPLMKRYACRFCTMEFHKSQALGGHMNRHKQERQNESWNKAYQLIQQGSRSLGSPVPSEHGASGVGSCNGMQYLDGSYNGKAYLDARLQLDVLADFSSFKCAEYLAARSSNATASDLNRNTQNFDARMFSPCMPSTNTPMPYESHREGFDNLFTSCSLHSRNETEVVQQHSARNFLDEHASALAPRGISLQDFTHQHTNMSPLSTLSSAQPGILQAEAAHGASFYEDRDPLYSYPSERTRECTFNAIANADAALTCQQSLTLMQPEADASHCTSYFGSQDANPVYSYPVERIREFTSSASGRALSEYLRYMYPGNQSNENEQHNQRSGRILDGNIGSAIDHQNLHHGALSAQDYNQGIAGIDAFDLRPRHTRITSGPMWSSHADAHRKMNALTTLQPTASGLAEYEGSCEENNEPFNKPD